MARLHEYQGKALLAGVGITIPRGGPADSAGAAADIAASLRTPVVVKIQAWTTARKAMGGIAFADTPAEASTHAARMLGMKVGNFPVTHVLVEEKLAITQELFVSLSIDDRERCPMLLISMKGGSGIEERASDVHRLNCDVANGPDLGRLHDVVTSGGYPAPTAAAIEAAIRAVFQLAQKVEARAVEINPLVVTSDGRVVAADCRITIDDYAVFRHPELNIEIARELDHPPTPLERVAYQVEQDDHRGTFFFAQMNSEAAPSPAGSTHTGGLIGFHGAGGGGSMMSMDAITNVGFTIANFCDTSGNPSPAKVYRAARLILSQPGLIGYFGSGSGVANQEQFWSAYGLAKAFWELSLDIPAVIRLGGNTEDRAVEILQSTCKGLPAPVEGYRKNDPPARIAARFAALVAEHVSRSSSPNWKPRAPRRPDYVGSPGARSFPVKGGRVWINLADWPTHAAAIVSRSNGLLRDAHGSPEPTVSPEELLGKDSDFIACEVECRRDGIPGIFVGLDIPGLAQAAGLA